MADDQNETADADGVEAEAEAKPKGGLKRLAPMILAPLLLAGGGFYATYSNVLGGGETDAHEEQTHEKEAAVENDVAYMELNEVIVPLAPTARSRVLIFEAALEIAPAELPEMEKLRPRILDVLNTYLRVVDHEALEDPSAMPLLRARLLRRLSVVSAPLEPKDILITTFVFK